MIIIAGLGNPGAKYEKNRHNIGFMAADEIARRWRFGAERAKFQSIVAEGEVETADGLVKVLLMKPQTYMNESGRAVGEAARFYKVKPQDIQNDPTVRVLLAKDAMLCAAAGVGNLAENANLLHRIGRSTFMREENE